MLRHCFRIVALLSALGLLVASVPATAAPAPPAASVLKDSHLSVYTLSYGRQEFARYGIRVDNAPSSVPRMDPLLLNLAQQGHAQNIRPMPDGTVRLLLDRAGADRLQAGGSSLVAAQPQRLAKEAITSVVTGTVTASGGGGVAGANITAILDSTVVTGTTDASGIYSLTLSAAGDYQIGVYADGYEWQPSVIVAVPPDTTGVNFSLVPQTNTIMGNVSTTGGPISGAYVTASDLAYDNFTAGDSTTTDASGNYTLTVSASTYEVRVFAPPLGVKSKTVQVPPSATGKDFVFDSVPLYTVSGVIRKANGQPLPFGELTISNNNVSINSCDAPFTQAPTAGADGSYSVLVPAGSYTVYANWSNDWGDHWVIGASRQLAVAANVTGFDLTLPAVGTISGQVRDPNGQPLANALVFSWRNDPNASPWFDGFFPTDISGNYVVTATLGSHKVLAFSDNYTTSSAQTVSLTGSSTGINLQVQNGVQITGQLTGSDGPGLRWASLSYLAGGQGAQFNRYATVYYNGRWRGVASTGPNTLNVSQAAYVEQSRQVNITSSPPAINFTLTRKNLRLTGKAKIVTGSGLCDTYLTAANVSSGTSSYGNSTGDGDYALMVASGTYNVFPYKYNSNSDTFNTRVTVPPVPASINFTVTESIFRDVFTNTYFYEPIAYLIYKGIASGYTDGTYRPYNDTTRGQLSKLVVNAQQWPIDTSGGPHFSDVPATNPFYTYIETAYHHGVISGYSDGTFRWGANVTRGQLSKIIVLSLGWSIDISGGPHFGDVSPGSAFYNYVETAVNKGVISGYSDGTFRPGNNATRGQIAKILYNSLTLP